MLPYWLLFTVWAAGAVQAERRRAHDPRIVFFIAAVIATTLMIGLRFEIGGDWGTYQEMYDDIFFLSLPAALRITDPGYAAVNWLSAQFGWGMAFVNLVCAALFMGGLARLAWKQPNPALAVLVAVPYLIIVVAMGYTRQAAAIGLICLAVADASERHLIRLIVLIGLATLFHKTALLILPVVLIPVLRRNKLLGALGAIVFAVLFVVFLRDSSDKMITSYAQSDYDSQGAAIRTAMNVLASITFLAIRGKIIVSDFQKSFWTACSVLSLVSVGALIILSASSGVDRLSLYLMPIQVVAYSNIYYASKKKEKGNAAILLLIIGYAFMVQFVWINYASNKYYWLPYRIFAS